MTIAAQAKITKTIVELETAALASQKLFRSRYGRSEDQGVSPCYVKFKKQSIAKIDKLEKQLAKETPGFTLPKTYRWFLARFGLLQVWQGRSPDGMELKHMFEPEGLGGVIYGETETAPARSTRTT